MRRSAHSGHLSATEINGNTEVLANSNLTPALNVTNAVGKLRNADPTKAPLLLPHVFTTMPCIIAGQWLGGVAATSFAVT
jgi:hypothetical protein